MGDKYTHSSFTLLQTTELIREVVDHVLRQPNSEVPAELRKDLASWRDEEEGREKGSDSVEDVDSTISFDLIKRAHKQLEKTPLGSDMLDAHYPALTHAQSLTDGSKFTLVLHLHVYTCIYYVYGSEVS